jgi:hypothetical protein
MTDAFLAQPLPPDLADLDQAGAASLAEAARAAGFAVLRLDGTAMDSKAALMAHAAAALAFPGDFGANWDALVDYLGDLATLHGNDRVLVLINSPEKIGGADPALRAKLREVLGFACENARQWSRGRVILKFAFAWTAKPTRA